MRKIGADFVAYREPALRGFDEAVNMLEAFRANGPESVEEPEHEEADDALCRRWRIVMRAARKFERQRFSQKRRIGFEIAARRRECRAVPYRRRFPGRYRRDRNRRSRRGRDVRACRRVLDFCGLSRQRGFCPSIRKVCANPGASFNASNSKGSARDSRLRDRVTFAGKPDRISQEISARQSPARCRGDLFCKTIAADGSWNCHRRVGAARRNGRRILLRDKRRSSLCCRHNRRLRCRAFCHSARG